MKRLVFLATAAGLFLVSNAPPPGEASDRAGYPRCSARVTDNCVQRVRGEPESRALDAMPAGEASGAPGGDYASAPAPAPVAAPAPRRVAARAYPPCSANRQDRCIQGRARHGHQVRYTRRVRHAGERG